MLLAASMVDNWVHPASLIIDLCNPLSTDVKLLFFTVVSLWYYCFDGLFFWLRLCCLLMHQVIRYKSMYKPINIIGLWQQNLRLIIRNISIICIIITIGEIETIFNSFNIGVK